MPGELTEWPSVVEGSMHLLEAMCAGRTVQISTEEVYGHFTADIIDENHPCRPLVPHGIRSLPSSRFRVVSA